MREARNKNLSLSVVLRKDQWFFSYKSHQLKLDPDFLPSASVVQKIQKKFMTKVIPVSSQAITLFHELLHWFHNIQNYSRYISDRRLDMAQPNSIYAFYYSGVSASHAPWIPPAAPDRIEGEEMRTILGYNAYHPVKKTIKNAAIMEAPGFLNGDELSENLFRCFLYSYMRKGKTSAITNSLAASFRFGHMNSLPVPAKHPEIERAFWITYQTCFAIHQYYHQYNWSLLSVPSWMAQQELTFSTFLRNIMTVSSV